MALDFQGKNLYQKSAQGNLDYIFRVWNRDQCLVFENLISKFAKKSSNTWNSCGNAYSSTC